MKAHEFGVEKEEEPELELTSDEAAVVEKVTRMNESESETFSDTNSFRYRIRYFFSIPNFFNTEFETFFEINLFRYRTRNNPKKEKVSKPKRHTLMGEEHSQELC